MRLFILLSVTILSFAPSCCADEQISLRSPQNHLLVLHSGRVVKGRLTPRTGGYDVALDAGRMFVSSEQIRFKAISMDDAYQRMRDSYTERTPNSHIELARWCMANKLNGSARRELLDVLHLDPYHTDAKRMLAGLVREQQRATRKVNPVVSLPGPLAPERRSLGGLTPKLATTFTRNIQPLLANKCGNARCHSAGRNSFSVVSIRGGATPYTTEQNLAAVLNAIDFAQPQQSSLLKAATEVHGGSRELFFRGQSGRRQIDLLKNWIMSVANESSPPAKSSGIESAVLRMSPQLPDRETTARRTPSSSRDVEFVAEAAAATREDRFNPQIFNHKFHGVPAETVGTDTR